MQFELLLNQPSPLERQQTVNCVRRFDPAFIGARIESGSGIPADPFILVIAEQRIALSASSEPHPVSTDLGMAIRAAHYGQELKNAALAHRATIRARWLSQGHSGLDAMVTLAGVLGALVSDNALVVVHAAAYASLPAQILVPDPVNGQRLPVLRSLPLGLLFTGFIKYEIEGDEGIWMASHNAALLGLPEFAMHTPDHSWGETVLDIFDRLQRHALDNRITYTEGDTATLSPDLTVRFDSVPSPLEFMTANRSWLIIRII